MHGGQVCRAILICVALSGSVNAQLNPNAERGREIYEDGTSPSGASIEASLGGGTRVAGSILPCANCHGHDGMGKPESGILSIEHHLGCANQAYTASRILTVAPIPPTRNACSGGNYNGN